MAHFAQFLPFHIGPEGNEFITFASGARGGRDYESDTYRVDSIIEN